MGNSSSTEKEQMIEGVGGFDHEERLNIMEYIDEWRQLRKDEEHLYETKLQIKNDHKISFLICISEGDTVRYKRAYSVKTYDQTMHTEVKDGIVYLKVKNLKWQHNERPDYLPVVVYPS